MADTIKIKQVRSTNGCKQDQVRTVRALGLHRIREVREIADNESVRGMIFKVKHLAQAGWRTQGHVLEGKLGK